MNINLNNYEEYFLLYADNELSESQKKIVELFAAANPQLSKELEEILSTVFKPDETSLADKSFLLKTPGELFINDQNFEEKFVAYHDDELTEPEKSLVDRFLETRKETLEDFHLVRQARLEADMSIVFPDKESLYRNTARVRRIGLIKLMAAAAITGLVIWLGINELRTSTEMPQQVAVTGQQPTTAPDTKVATETAKLKEAHPATEAEESHAATEKEELSKESTNPQARFASAKQKEEAEPVQAPPLNITTDEAGELATGIKIALTEPEPPRPQVKKVVMEDREIFASSEEPQLIRFVSFEPEPESDEYVFFDIPAETLKRSKVGVLFKKVKRTIDRNNPINRLFNADETE